MIIDGEMNGARNYRFRSGEIDLKPATSHWELKAYYRLRRAIFVEEERIFEKDDRDAYDAHAFPIVALAKYAHMRDSAVGVVRIYESEPGVWWGGRLGIHADYRGAGVLGPALIRKAVTMAQNIGCQKFLATVLDKNSLFFRRWHWETLEHVTLHDRKHHLMQADLAFYPPLEIKDVEECLRLKAA